MNPDRLFVNNNECLVDYFKRGIGYGTLTKEVARENIDKGDLILLNGGKVRKEKLSLAWYKRPQMPEYFQDILSSVR